MSGYMLFACLTLWTDFKLILGAWAISFFFSDVQEYLEEYVGSKTRRSILYQVRKVCHLRKKIISKKFSNSAYIYISTCTFTMKFQCLQIILGLAYRLQLLKLFAVYAKSMRYLINYLLYLHCNL